MSTSNPFVERQPAKKRVITVSVTAEQDSEFEAMKRYFNKSTDGALIKLALEDLWRKKDRALRNGTEATLHDPPDGIGLNGGAPR